LTTTPLVERASKLEQPPLRVLDEFYRRESYPATPPLAAAERLEFARAAAGTAAEVAFELRLVVAGDGEFNRWYLIVWNWP
jgi:hypothetical protein